VSADGMSSYATVILVTIIIVNLMLLSLWITTFIHHLHN